ncbi:UDP-N-acetylmuramoyl-tripeptide--D-alanyl-D-alanine ligase [Shewanella sp. SR44-3]|uniref:UDP-N-acetylmuramoyl-tripeptide--D-alanyl-D- alanine ligase n=1 Tax=unclassified Shewanella TaxID=196818 RepID=UPI0015FA8AF4|nr:UDP-N-acetylmuramoyl-tripeptide--D-alanyl-D-alanine ligase [Shewanella sp. SR44-3]MBB1270267.1 UDP-N-acetylmuramoyl-tripeptide--D-alanyl-D-alanine ligase [Shewanella sp. SR44-3]
MIELTLAALAAHLNAKHLGADLTIANVSTDSRAIPASCLFVALKGERFDGHDFAATAIDNGAKALLVERELAVDIPQLVVANSQKAMGEIGALIRQIVSPKCVALTGSNGKTSVKEMVASILSQAHQVLYTAGNFNNEIGVPLTLLRLTQGDEYGVFELGANHKGEIDYTSSLVRPSVALVNNIGSAHLEGFGSIEGIAEAKSEIFNHLSADGVAVINADDAFFGLMQTKAAAFKQLSFSREANTHADIKATALKMDVAGCYGFIINYQQQQLAVQLPLAGIHQVSNALAASAMCLALGISLSEVVSGLSALAPVKGRMQPHPLGRLLVIDDSYNANPSSVSAAIDWLKNRDGFCCLVLGDLGELGDNAALLHKQVGQQAKEAQIDGLFCCGSLTEHTSLAFGSQHYAELPALLVELTSVIKANRGTVTVLVKGSRSARMERVVENLLNAYEHGELV